MPVEIWAFFYTLFTQIQEKIRPLRNMRCIWYAFYPFKQSHRYVILRTHDRICTTQTHTQIIGNNRLQYIYIKLFKEKLNFSSLTIIYCTCTNMHQVCNCKISTFCSSVYSNSVRKKHAVIARFELVVISVYPWRFLHTDIANT